MKKKKRKMSIVILTILSMFGIGGYYSKDIIRFVNDNITNTISFNNSIKFKHSYNIDNLPKYSGEDYIVINNNEPLFDEKYINTKSSGWHTVKYNNIDGKYLYNRCHLIGYQLTGENANEKNLITCTRHMNTISMLKFENMVSSYIKETNNHVLYRVTPIYDGDNLLASGVQMEALSIEDNGEGIKFNIFVYNIQDGIEIDYRTGESRLIKNS